MFVDVFDLAVIVCIKCWLRVWVLAFIFYVKVNNFKNKSGGRSKNKLKEYFILYIYI